MPRKSTEDAATQRWAEKVREWAGTATGYGVQPKEVNKILVRVGVDPLNEGDSNRPTARYKVTQYNRLALTATDRDGALAELRGYVRVNNSKGNTYYSSHLEGHDVDPDTVEFQWRRDDEWVSTDEYFTTTPEPEVEVPATLADKKALLRTLAVEFYRMHAGKFCQSGARDAFRQMDIGQVPRQVHRTVQVPVTQATVEVTVAVFEDDDEAQILAATQRELEDRRRRREVGYVPAGAQLAFGEPVVVAAKTAA